MHGAYIDTSASTIATRATNISDIVPLRSRGTACSTSMYVALIQMELEMESLSVCKTVQSIKPYVYIEKNTKRGKK